MSILVRNKQTWKDVLDQYKGFYNVVRGFQLVKQFPALKDQIIPYVYEKLKSGFNADVYKNFTKDKSNSIPGKFEFEQGVYNNLSQKGKSALNGLAEQLAQDKGTMIVKNIHACLVKIANTNIDVGDYATAYTSFGQAMNDYPVQEGDDNSECVIGVLRSLLYQEKKDDIEKYLSRIDVRNIDTSNQQLKKLYSSVRLFGGLAALMQANFTKAQKCFVDVFVEIENEFNEFLVPADIASIGVILSIAVLDRSTLKSHVIESSMFKRILERNDDASKLLEEFYNRNYKETLVIYNRMRPILLSTPFFSGHFDNNAALHLLFLNALYLAYLVPFAAVDLSIMAGEMGIPVIDMEKRATELVMKGRLRAKIDLTSHQLFMSKSDQRAEALSATLQSIDDYVDTLHTQLVFMNAKVAVTHVKEEERRNKQREKEFEGRGPHGPGGGMMDLMMQGMRGLGGF